MKTLTGPPLNYCTPIRLAAAGVVVGVVVGLCSAAQAQSPKPKDTTKQWLEDNRLAKNRQNLTKWKGIQFNCLAYPLGEKKVPDDPLFEICDRTKTNVDFLAASAKVKISHSGDIDWAKDDPFQYLRLEVDFTATKLGSPSAIFATVRAHSYYGTATESSYTFPPDYAEKMKSHPQSVPRKGDLELWSDAHLWASSGTHSRLVESVSKSIEQSLKKFFIDYLKAQEKN